MSWCTSSFWLQVLPSQTTGILEAFLASREFLVITSMALSLTWCKSRDCNTCYNSCAFISVFIICVVSFLFQVGVVFSFFSLHLQCMGLIRRVLQDLDKGPGKGARSLMLSMKSGILSHRQHFHRSELCACRNKMTNMCVQYIV